MNKIPIPKRLFRVNIKMGMLLCYASQFTEKIPAKIVEINRNSYVINDPFTNKRLGETTGTTRLFKYNSLSLDQKLTREQADYEENRGEDSDY